MSDPIEGRFGQLVMTGWQGETPDGSWAAYLLLTTPDERASQTMPFVAEVLGLNPAGGSVTMKPSSDAYVSVSGDLWATLHVGDQKFTRPVDGEWRELAVGQSRVVVVLGYRPMDSTDHPYDYVEEASEVGEVVLGIFPARLEP